MFNYMALPKGYEQELHNFDKAKEHGEGMGDRFGKYVELVDKDQMDMLRWAMLNQEHFATCSSFKTLQVDVRSVMGGPNNVVTEKPAPCDCGLPELKAAFMPEPKCFNTKAIVIERHIRTAFGGLQSIDVPKGAKYIGAFSDSSNLTLYFETTAGADCDDRRLFATYKSGDTHTSGGEYRSSVIVSGESAGYTLHIYEVSR